jgi:hypothetical protein
MAALAAPIATHDCSPPVTLPVAYVTARIRLEVDQRLAPVRVQELLAQHLQPLFLRGKERLALLFGVPGHDDDVLAPVLVIDDIEADEAVGCL